MYQDIGWEQPKLNRHWWHIQKWPKPQLLAIHMISKDRAFMPMSPWWLMRLLMISWPPSYANGHEKKLAPSQRPTYCNGRHNCQKRARARSCGAFYGKSPPMNMIS